MHHMIVSHHINPRQSPIAKLVSNTKASSAQKLERSGTSSIEKSGAKSQMDGRGNMTIGGCWLNGVGTMTYALLQSRDQNDTALTIDRH